MPTHFEPEISQAGINNIEVLINSGWKISNYFIDQDLNGRKVVKFNIQREEKED